MLELYNLGIQEQELKFIIEQCPEILDTPEKEIKEKIELLKLIECSEIHIRNIICSNPNYLTRLNKDITDLMKKLSTLGLNTLNLLFDSNPFLLNKDSFEIDDYITKKQKQGESLIDILDEIESNPYIIDEY